MNRQTNKNRKPLIILLFILVVGIIAFFIAQNWYNDAIYNPPANATTRYELEVTEGETLLEVMADLEAKGLVKSKLAVQLYLRQFNLSPVIKHGSYVIDPKTNIPQLIEILEKGVFKPGILVTLKEGWRYEQMTVELDKNLGNSFDALEFEKIAANPDNYKFSSSTVQKFLDTYKPIGKPLRGFLYPDTYEFAEDITAQQVVEKMLENFIVKTKDLQIQNLNSNQDNITNLYDALILASVIEKEASKLDDRKDISAVFHNRLAQGYPLQSDATVNFITGQNEPGVDLEDTYIDNPYNTYKYAGLMPTPINNPRLESINAALYPNQTEYFFFFHDDAGKTYFSVTFEEHSLKVSQIRGYN